MIIMQFLTGITTASVFAVSIPNNIYHQSSTNG